MGDYFDGFDDIQYDDFFGDYGFSGGAFWIDEEQDDPFYFLDDEY